MQYFTFIYVKRMQGSRIVLFVWYRMYYYHLQFSVAKATLQSQMSVRLSVCLSPKPLSLSELLLPTIEAIGHQAY